MDSYILKESILWSVSNVTTDICNTGDLNQCINRNYSICSYL